MTRSGLIMVMATEVTATLMVTEVMDSEDIMAACTVDITAGITVVIMGAFGAADIPEWFCMGRMLLLTEEMNDPALCLQGGMPVPALQALFRE